MAKGKKSSGKHYTSKGERSNTSRWLKNACRRDYLENRKIERTNNQMNAFLKGKRVMLTIENPNKNETNKKFIRVPAGEVWKTGSYSMKSSG
jgi:ribosomal protein L21E